MGVLFCLSIKGGEQPGQSHLIHDPRHPHNLVPHGRNGAARRTNAPDSFRDLLSKRIKELGITEVEELLLDWYDRLTDWHIGVSL